MSDPKIRSGEPCITGTRLMVSDLINFIAKVESQAIETADSYWKGRYDGLSESIKAIESQALQRAKERVERVMMIVPPQGGTIYIKRKDALKAIGGE